MCHWDRQIWRHTHKRDAQKKLKTPVVDRVIKTFTFSPSFQNERGTFGNIELERKITAQELPFTKAGILEAVNQISTETYTDIQIVDR